MSKQKLKIKTNANDPFSYREVIVESDGKIYCNEPYVLEDLKKYDQYLGIKSYQESNTDTLTKGVVLSINTNNGHKVSALFDLGGKYTAECNLLKESDDVVDVIEVGKELDVKVKTVNSNLIVSIGDAMVESMKNELMDNVGKNKFAFKGKILECIHGGYWVNVSGVKCFMPGSLVALNKVNDFEKFVGNEMEFMPVAYSKEKKSIVVSHREFLHTMIPTTINDLKKNIKEKITGFVTGTTEFGVFCEFNKCLTGLIAKDELDDETLELFKNKAINPDDTISFYVKDIVSDKKILLSQKGPKKDAWEEAIEKYKNIEGGVGTVSKVTDFGIFIELEKGVFGFVNKYRMPNKELKRGDNVFYKITNINYKEKKISLDLSI